MSRTQAWALIAVGLIVDATVFILPFTPYPLVHMALDGDALAVSRGYQKLIDTGFLTEGDPGFELLRGEFMDNVAQGSLRGVDASRFVGLTVARFQLDEESGGSTTFAILSNGEGHQVPTDRLKLMYGVFQRPYAALVNLVLLILGSAAIYGGLKRITGIPDANEQAKEVPTAGNALSSPRRS